MIIQRFGHAALLIEAAGSRVLVDPGTYSTDDTFALPDLDVIVITHQHPDHVDPARLPGLLAAAPDARLLVEPQTIATMPVLADRAVPLRPGEVSTVGELSIRAVGGAHAVIHPDLPSVGNVGVTIGGGGEPTLFHPGDAYDPAPVGVDILALPMSAPWAKLSETVEFVRRVRPSLVVPIHDRALSELGYPIYRRTVEALGGAGRYEWIAGDGRLDAG